MHSSERCIHQKDEVIWKIVWEYAGSNSPAHLRAIYADYYIVASYKISLNPLTSFRNVDFENFTKVVDRMPIILQQVVLNFTGLKGAVKNSDR